MSPKEPRTRDCNPTDARTRLRQSDALLMVATLVIDDDTQTATPGVAAALAVLAGIAASDAACCHRLHRRARGQNHQEAVALLRTVEPHGPDMAKDLAELLAAKDDAHYGLTLVSPTTANRLLTRAQRLNNKAHQLTAE